MSGSVLFFFYGSIVFCISACAVKLFIYARFPVHLRWETYNAGSVYERRNSWQKQGIGPFEKLADIIKNIATLSDYYNNNRLFWLALYPFHLGMYLLILWHVWLFVYPVVSREAWPVDYSLIWGHTATGLIFIGAFGILSMRIFVRALRTSYPRRHYLKWLMIMLAAGSGYIAVEYYFNGVMANVLGYVKHQLEFDVESKLNPPLPTSLHVITVSAVLIYLPFSHALRLFFRYYHDWRWNYAPNAGKSSVSRNIKAALEYPVAWAALKAPKGTVWRDLAPKNQTVYKGFMKVSDFFPKKRRSATPETGQLQLVQRPPAEDPLDRKYYDYLMAEFSGTEIFEKQEALKVLIRYTGCPMGARNYLRLLVQGGFVRQAVPVSTEKAGLKTVFERG